VAGDLSVTALYTSQVWRWGGLPCAHLFATPEAERVFAVTNAALRLVRGAPLRIALLQRHAMIDRLLRASGAGRVIELGAGLSRRGATYAGAIDYVEVDLPEVIGRKRQLLERTAEGRAVLARLRLAEGDALEAPLAALAPGLGRVLVIAEGLVMYLDGAARRRLLANVRRLAETAGEVQLVFDLTPSAEEPPPGPLGRVLEAAMKRATGGRGFERDAETRGQVMAELAEAGFGELAATAARDVACAWRLPFPERRTATVVFSAAARATRP
jgi:O-methyltransferase involved in polyketide biosynthesis